MTFEEYAAARLPALLRYATVLTCDPHMAEDIVQEVLLRVHRKWRRIQALDIPDIYVRRMVTNQFLSWRRRKSAADVPLSPQVMAGLGPEVQDPAHGYDERDALLVSIAALPRKQRAALVLRYFCDLPDDQVAAVLGCGQVTVRSHISRALATLRITPVTTSSRA